ncbi:hypothetical protein LB572_29325 [Mesorhizobium sp. BH1-1-5]|uniref:hypothetical protein n=1 Tax=unclassified Mesorhizobium TaxID=325217 RepID=UPI0015E4795F|nr:MULTISPECIES: hypothetical protein [unclassified Mesorhizobium]MBZ9991200.1 hypothetical protein [Mesorhizobium sp. BH1-1-5]
MASGDKSKSTENQERQPRKDTDREKQEAAAKTPGKTNDWDRDAVHGDGDTVGIEPGTE